LVEVTVSQRTVNMKAPLPRNKVIAYTSTAVSLENSVTGVKKVETCCGVTQYAAGPFRLGWSAGVLQ
jgi:hypothetical protein